MTYTSTQERLALAEMVDDLLSREWSAAQVRALEASGELWSGRLWSALGAVDLLSLGLARDYQGAGCGMAEIRVVCEALGEHLGLVPYVWSSVLSTWLASRAQPGPVRDRLLEALGKRETVVSVAVADPSALANVARLLAPASSPRQLFAPYASAAELLLLLSQAKPTTGGYAIPLVSLDDVTLLPQTRSDLLSIARLPAVPESAVADRLVVDHATAAGALAAWKVAIAATALGAQRKLIATCVEYASGRAQFGRPIGSYQAVAHKIVDLHVRALSDEMLVDLACAQLDDGHSDADTTAAMAKARATEGLADAGAAALQVHAGHGFSADGDVQLYFRFGRGLEVTWGSPHHEYKGAVT